MPLWQTLPLEGPWCGWAHTPTPTPTMAESSGMLGRAVVRDGGVAWDFGAGQTWVFISLLRGVSPFLHTQALHAHLQVPHHRALPHARCFLHLLFRFNSPTNQIRLVSPNTVLITQRLCRKQLIQIHTACSSLCAGCPLHRLLDDWGQPQPHARGHGAARLNRSRFAAVPSCH